MYVNGGRVIVAMNNGFGQVCVFADDSNWSMYVNNKPISPLRHLWPGTTIHYKLSCVHVDNVFFV
jgi:hypothetical protein